MSLIRLIVVCALFVWCSVASAQQDGSARGLAEELFREAKRLMTEGRHAEACPKLAESQRLDPAGGTALTLALCLEAQGKIASSWNAFQDALSLAVRDRRPDRERIARDHIRALEPRLPRLSIRVPAEVRALPLLSVSQDGVTLGSAAWDVAAPVDPGTHQVEARAHGKRPWSVEIAIVEGQSQTIDVPELEADAPIQPAKSLPDAPAKRVAAKRAPRKRAVPAADPWRTTAYVSAGVGAVGVVVGGISLWRAFDLAGRADDRCPQVECDDPEAVSLDERAGTAADVATVGFVVATAALATAGYLLFVREPRSSARASRHLIVRW